MDRIGGRRNNPQGIEDYSSVPQSLSPNFQKLIIDDEADLREIIVEYAKYGNYEIMEAEDGIKGIELVKQNDFDLIIVDVMMPKIDGFSTVKEIKKIKDILVIMLSAKSQEYDKLYGYEVGIDDYITKPFSPRELMAKIKVITSRKKDSSSSKYTFGNVVIDSDLRRVTIDNDLVEFTLKEYDTLIYLISSTVRVMTIQLVYITIFALIFAVILAVILSKKLSRPIYIINEKAKELEKGNFDIYFKDGYYTEIDELSNTLNNAKEKLKIITSNI